MKRTNIVILIGYFKVKNRTEVGRSEKLKDVKRIVKLVKNWSRKEY